MIADAKGRLNRGPGRAGRVKSAGAALFFILLTGYSTQ